MKNKNTILIYLVRKQTEITKSVNNKDARKDGKLVIVVALPSGWLIDFTLIFLNISSKLPHNLQTITKNRVFSC